MYWSKLSLNTRMHGLLLPSMESTESAILVDHLLEGTFEELYPLVEGN